MVGKFRFWEWEEGEVPAEHSFGVEETFDCILPAGLNLGRINCGGFRFRRTQMRSLNAS